MSDSTIRVYVDGNAVDVPPGSSALDAVRTVDSAIADAVSSGSRALTDSRGLPISADAPMHGGAILRIVASRPVQPG